jgi:hypothetical protein
MNFIILIEVTISMRDHNDSNFIQSIKPLLRNGCNSSPLLIGLHSDNNAGKRK